MALDESFRAGQTHSDLSHHDMIARIDGKNKTKPYLACDNRSCCSG